MDEGVDMMEVVVWVLEVGQEAWTLQEAIDTEKQEFLRLAMNPLVSVMCLLHPSRRRELHN